MPAKNKLKIYKEGGIYHIYNRGLDGREIFKEQGDYLYFEKLLERYVGAQTSEERPGFKLDRPSVVRHRQEMSLYGFVDVVAYCLMPTHYHLVLRQRDREGMTRLMRRLMTGYVMYYNQKYRRSGPLLENVYRAVVVPDGETLLHLTRMVHLNPVARSVVRFGLVETVTGSTPGEYAYSSYSQYIGKNDKSWVNTTLIKMSQEEYKNFAENRKIDSNEVLVKVMLD
jgi:putative transposase